MASINDVAEADRAVEEVITEMQEVEDSEVGYDVYIATKAVCYAIRALGVRLDYAVNELRKGSS